MCGIIAHIAFNEGSRISKPVLDSLNQLLIHRGPDSGGSYLKGDVALAMRRLSIIDLLGGDQPIISEDGRYVIVFNGEIYNHEEIRAGLIQKGYNLKTRSDTEVLLYAFIDRGAGCLSDLNGMFAFAIWDNKNQQLFVARDRLGIKPLYYAFNDKRVMFCSELKPIYRSGFFPLKFNYRAISDYLAYWYICEPNAIFEDIFQLPPGSYAVIQKGKMQKHQYWNIPADGETTITFQEASMQLKDLLEDAIRLRMKVDVPIGTFLSGGVDSGLVTAIAARHINERLKSFSIGFKEESYSELKEANATADKCGVTLASFQIGKLTPEMLDAIFLAFDEPLGNASFVPTYFLARRAREDVKVVLTGDGGDELFGGYPTYQAPYYQAAYRRIPAFLRNLARFGIQRLPVSHNRISLDYRLKHLMEGISLSYQRAHYTWREVTPLQVQERLFRRDIWRTISDYDPFQVADRYFDKARSLSVKNQLMYVDMNTYLLNDHLRKVDRMAMAHSLEARVPYLDHRIVEFAARLPSQYKISFSQTKRLLKYTARDYLPKAVIYGKKKGLTSPIASWIYSELRDYINDLLKGGVVEELFEPRAVNLLLDEHYKKQKDNSRIIWGLAALQGWSKNLTGDHIKTGEEI